MFVYRNHPAFAKASGNKLDCVLALECIDYVDAIELYLRPISALLQYLRYGY